MGTRPIPKLEFLNVAARLAAGYVPRFTAEHSGYSFISGQVAFIAATLPVFIDLIRDGGSRYRVQHLRIWVELARSFNDLRLLLRQLARTGLLRGLGLLHGFGRQSFWL